MIGAFSGSLNLLHIVGGQFGQPLQAVTALAAAREAVETVLKHAAILQSLNGTALFVRA